MEEFSTAVHAGHPTMMLIDDRGIIRGRWDAWSPGTVANAALAVWVLKIVPQQGVTLDLDLARQYMKEKNYLHLQRITEGLYPAARQSASARHQFMLTPQDTAL